MEEMNLTIGGIKRSIEKNKEDFFNKNINLHQIYVDVCNNTDNLTRILGPNCDIAVENVDFLTRIMFKLYGNKTKQI